MAESIEDNIVAHLDSKRARSEKPLSEDEKLASLQSRIIKNLHDAREAFDILKRKESEPMPDRRFRAGKEQYDIRMADHIKKRKELREIIEAIKRDIELFEHEKNPKNKNIFLTEDIVKSIKIFVLSARRHIES